jgi:Ca2+-binding EF-hand superfamily protein
MNARKTMIAIAIAALIPLGAAVAGDNDQYGSKDKMGSSSFKKLDTNKDGKISQAEAAVDSTIVFSTADANGDGYLDTDEWKASAKSGSSKPQSTSPSEPDSTMPESTEPTGQPAPDTETPRQ